jgi:predicted RecB family nuclease
VAIAISKSRFLAGCQCLKRLYLQVHQPELAPAAVGAVEAIITQGHEIGILARQLFPGGIEVSVPGGLGQAIRTTKELLANPDVPAIFEGAFEHQGVLVKTDVLQRREKSHWRLVEVKSTTDLKDQHVDDVAIQTHVLSNSGLKLASSWLAHVNREYVFAGTTVEPRQFFIFRNLTQRVRNLQPEVVIRLRTQFSTLEETEPPNISPGPHCTKPMVCEFFYHCNQPLAKDHIGYLPRLHASAAEELQEMGIESIADIPADFKLSEMQRRACDAMQTGQPWFSSDLKTELESLKYPIYFMDFETVNPAIPRFSGMHPYDHLPFQWSVHVQREPGATAAHFEFLACDNSDPRSAFISSLCEALHEEGSIVVYNGQFESQRLWELASWLPAYLERIRAIQRRLWDLLPVVRNHVYHPEFGGSFSLKAVLPALVPDMTYEGMEVPNGQAAGVAWETMIRSNAGEPERQAKRKVLLDYCGQDTLALLRLLEKLRLTLN